MLAGLLRRPGSTHGYDVIDPSRVNPELGGDAEFEALAADLQQRGMGPGDRHRAEPHGRQFAQRLVDGCPRERNHFGYALPFFDIEWDPAWERGDEKIFLPVLGSPFGTVLENGELRLGDRRSGFSINYYETKLPIDPGYLLRDVSAGAPASGPHSAFQDLMDILERLPDRRTRVWEGIEARRREIPAIKAKLWSCTREQRRCSRLRLTRHCSAISTAPGRRRELRPLRDAHR
jgi:(1->4)-alpha-D-glucan 1-alpha-D-glucosylmutase